MAEQRPNLDRQTWKTYVSNGHIGIYRGEGTPRYDPQGIVLHMDKQGPAAEAQARWIAKVLQDSPEPLLLRMNLIIQDLHVAVKNVVLVVRTWLEHGQNEQPMTELVTRMLARWEGLVRKLMAVYDDEREYEAGANHGSATAMTRAYWEYVSWEACALYDLGEDHLRTFIDELERLGTYQWAVDSLSNALDQDIRSPQ